LLLTGFVWEKRKSGEAEKWRSGDAETWKCGDVEKG
jgi:hypothetical protein